MRNFGRLAEILSWEARKLDSEKLKRVQDVLSQVYSDIEDILQVGK